ncbi:unnamed protein product, partial [Didymodactylos carnosus]
MVYSQWIAGIGSIASFISLILYGYLLIYVPFFKSTIRDEVQYDCSTGVKVEISDPKTLLANNIMILLNESMQCTQKHIRVDRNQEKALNFARVLAQIAPPL